MKDNSVVTLDQEIIRLCKTHFNNTEPPTIATVTKVNSTTADVKHVIYDEEGTLQNIIDRDIPIVKPVYGDTSLNLEIGDKVLLCFVGGTESNPYIVGKV